LTRDVERRHDHQHGRVVEECAHQEEAELHQDQDLPGFERFQLAEEEALDGAHRAEPVEHGAETQRRQDDPHEHAGDAERLAQTFSITSGQPPLMSAAAIAASAPTAELSTRLVSPSGTARSSGRRS
jgi:hypothetical protein